MSQKKKSQYQIYGLMLDNEVKTIRKLMPDILPTSACEGDWLQVMFKSVPDYVKTLNFVIFGEEYYWRTHGANVVFPEHGDVLDNLLRARYDIGSGEGFSLPFSSFTLSVPQGYQVDGVAIPSFLVTCIPYEQTHELITRPFSNYAKFKGEPRTNLQESLGRLSIAICYRDPLCHTAYARTLIGDAQIPALLKAKTTAEFRDILGHYQCFVAMHDLSEHDLKLQMHMMRLVASIGIYNMATNGERLKSGFPGGQEPRYIGKLPEAPVHFTTLKNSLPASSAQGSLDKGSYYRTWFFRQLRDDRYYRGEYENYPKGSRYVFVSDTVVGQKVTAHTQG